MNATAPYHLRCVQLLVMYRRTSKSCSHTCRRFACFESGFGSYVSIYQYIATFPITRSGTETRLFFGSSMITLPPNSPHHSPPWIFFSVEHELSFGMVPDYQTTLLCDSTTTHQTTILVQFRKGTPVGTFRTINQSYLSSLSNLTGILRS
jgi:hypothetical protein